MERRQFTTALTLLILVGLLVMGAVWGWRQMFANLPGGGLASGNPTPTCTTEQVKGGEEVHSRQVTVSVYNGGTRPGLAGKTLDALVKRKFIAGDTDNAPSDIKVQMVEVRTTIENDVEARLVARQFGREVRVHVVKEDLGPGVDVIVGNAFKKLAKAPLTMEAEQPQEVCVPAESPQPSG